MFLIYLLNLKLSGTEVGISQENWVSIMAADALASYVTEAYEVIGRG